MWTFYLYTLLRFFKFPYNFCRDFRHTCNPRDNYMHFTGYVLRHRDPPYFLLFIGEKFAVQPSAYSSNPMNSNQNAWIILLLLGRDRKNIFWCFSTFHVEILQTVIFFNSVTDSGRKKTDDFRYCAQLDKTRIWNLNLESFEEL